MKRLLLFVLLLAASFSWAQEKKPLCIYGFNPFHVSEENLGIAFSYERFIDNKGIFSLYMPISIAFPEVERNNYNTTYFTSQSTTNRNLTYFNAYPGIKIYPGGSNKRVSYAVGASLVMAIGKQNQTTMYYKADTLNPYNYVFDYKTSSNVNAFKFGMLITNSLNIRPTNNFYFGVEFGLGYTYLNSLNAVASNRETLVQFGLKFGYIK
ncbi:MAG: hypothetical protein KGN97_01370 [Bacteroidota bacterium]|nr:hypothetical protein [Bacteroidota bacterium]